MILIAFEVANVSIASNVLTENRTDKISFYVHGKEVTLNSIGDNACVNMSLATPSDAYLTDYSAEIYFLSTEDDKTLFHTYISYDMDKIKGHFGTEDYNKFRMKAWANVPLSDSEILRLRVYVLRNNEIEDFTVQYEAKLNGNKRKTVLPLKSGNSYQDADKIIFRSDYGHVDSRRNKLKHTNVGF